MKIEESDFRYPPGCVGSSFFLPITGAGQLSSAALATPITIPSNGRKYAMTVYDPTDSSCQVRWLGVFLI